MSVVGAGDCSEGVEICVQFRFYNDAMLTGSLCCADFPQHLEERQQMEFYAPKNPRHPITGSQAAIQRKCLANQ